MTLLEPLDASHMGSIVTVFCPHRSSKSSARDRWEERARRRKDFAAKFGGLGSDDEADYEWLARLRAMPRPEGPFPWDTKKIARDLADPEQRKKKTDLSAQLAGGYGSLFDDECGDEADEWLARLTAAQRLAPRPEAPRPSQPASSSSEPTADAMGLGAELARLRRDLGAELGIPDPRVKAKAKPKPIVRAPTPAAKVPAPQTRTVPTLSQATLPPPVASQVTSPLPPPVLSPVTSLAPTPAPNSAQRSGEEKSKSQPANSISQSQLVKLKRQSVGNTPQAWSAYEQLLRVCEPHHSWCWIRDDKLSEFWRSLPVKDQDEITDVTSRSFHDLVLEHVAMHTCYCKNFVDASKEFIIANIEEGYASSMQEFFRTAVSEGACIALNWQGLEAIDAIVQDITRVGGLREFSHGSVDWCKQQEEQHTRLALLRMIPEIFERRLLSRWEKQHGRMAQRKQEEKTDRKKKNVESAAARHTRFVLEHLTARTAKVPDELVDIRKSAKLIENLCQKLKRASNGLHEQH